MPEKGPGRGFTPNAYSDGSHERPQREHHHSEGLPNAPFQRTNESKTAILCNDQGHERAQCYQRQRFTCWEEGCNRQAKTGPMSREGEIDLFCLDHQSSETIATRTANCQFNGCLNTPKYGQRKGPLKFCQHHKRAGMYTNRNSRLLLATRDGSGFGRTDEETNPPGRRKTFQMPVRLWSSRAKNAGMSPAFGGMAATQQYRKMCEVPGCRIQPSYGPKGTSRPRFCSSHKKKGMVGLKNRPCNFPGCSTRPHYGLLGCRPIYCAKHKEPNMVHLLKEATTREKMGTMRDLGQRASPPLEPMRSASKLLLSVIRSKKKKAQRTVPGKNVAIFQAGDDHVFDGRESASPLPLLPSQQQRKQENDEMERSETNFRRTNTLSISTASFSSTSISTSASSDISTESSSIAAVSSQLIDLIRTLHPSKYGNASGASTPPPEKSSSSRLAKSLGSTPSYGEGIFKGAKESIQAELTTRCSGKRARVPSRKAMEASGKLKIHDTQWLTKDRKEEEARRMKEFRAQRKAAAAIGLKTGQVIEAATVGPAVNGEGRCTGASGVGDGAESEATRLMWRKLSPAEIFEVGARTTTTNVIDKARPGGRGNSESGTEVMDNEMRKGDVKDASIVTSGVKRKETVWTPQGTTKAITPKSDTFCPLDAKRSEKLPRDMSVQLRQAMLYSDRQEPRDVSGRVSTGENAVTVGEGDVDEMKQTTRPLRHAPDQRPYIDVTVYVGTSVNRANL